MENFVVEDTTHTDMKLDKYTPETIIIYALTFGKNPHRWEKHCLISY